MDSQKSTLTAGYGGTNINKYSGILEINAANRQELVDSLDVNRKPVAIHELLTDSIFAGNAVLDVSMPSVPDDPCHVPHFGHGAHCEPDTCDGPGIFRLFGFSCIVAKTSNKETFGQYSITPTIQVDICGKKSYEPGTTPREPIREQESR